MKTLALLLTFAACSAVFAQPDTLWSRTYGGSYSDYCYSVRQTADNGFVLAGYTTHTSFGPEDFYLVKTNANGLPQWERSYGGPSVDVCWQIRPVAAGGYILAGSSQSYGAGTQDGWIVRVDESGDSLWSKTYGGAGWDEIYSVDPTDDGGFILGGYTGSFGMGAFDFWLIKTDANGDTTWTRTFGYSNDGEFATSVLQVSDGGYLISGFKGNFTPTNTYFWIVRTDAAGDSIWSARPALGECFAMRETRDGGIVLIGIDQEGDGGDARVIKLDGSGNTVWMRDIGGDFEDLGSVIEQTHDGGYICAGYTRSWGAGTRDVWVFKLDADGDSLWSTTIGGADFESCSSIQQLADGSYLLAGGTQSFGSGMYDFYLIQMEQEWPEPPLIVYPPELEFGIRPIGVESDMSVLIRNTTTMPIMLVEAVTELEAFSAVDFTPGYLDPGDSTEITVRFYPTASFDYYDTLTVVTPLSSFLLRVPLHGVGAEFHVYIPYTSINMSTSHGESDTAIVPLINDGEVDAIIYAAYFTAHEDVFSVSPLSAFLPAGNQQEFEVVFNPTVIDTYNSNLCFVHNIPPDSEICIPVIGEIETSHADDQTEGLPNDYFLAEAYPNPFNPSTTIEFGLPQASPVTLTVFDLTGRLVETIVQQQLPAGRHSVSFNGHNLSSGIYFYTLSAGSYSACQKMILLK